MNTGLILKSAAVLGAAAVTLFSCTKEDITPAPGIGEGSHLEIYAGSGDFGTKTILNEKYMYPQWIAKDTLFVFDSDGTGVAFTSGVTTPAYTATFATDEWTGKTPRYAAFTGGTATSPSEGVLRVNIPGVQAAANENSFAQRANPSVGTISESDGNYVIDTMRNVAALIAFSVKDTNIVSITIEGGAGEQIAGDVDVDCSTLSWSAAADGDVQTSVTLTQTGKRASVAHTVNGETVHTFLPVYNGDSLNTYAAVLPCTYSQGLKFTLTKLDGSTVVRTLRSSTGLTLSRNQVIRFTSPIDDANSDFEISDLASLKRFLRNLSKYTDGQTVKVTADIDCGGTNFFEAVMDSSFVGILDGQGHKIYNYVRTTRYKGYLIRTLAGNGMIKNLIVGSSDGENYDGTSVLRHSGNDTGVPIQGLVAYVRGSASMENVTNFCKIEDTASNTGTTSYSRYAGGVVGLWYSSGSATSLKNYGDITSDPGESGKRYGNYFVGGVIGMINPTLGSDNDSMTISGCENHGAILVQNGTYNTLVRAAGVVSTVTGAVTMTSCANYGTVTVTGLTLSEQVYFAGVAGYVDNNYAATVSNCTNTAAVTVNVTGANTKSKTWFAGGVVAGSPSGNASNPDHIFSGNVNRGAINITTNAWLSTTFIGGVCGRHFSGVFSSCENYGDITYTNDNSGQTTVYLGGVIGAITRSANGLTAECDVTLKNPYNWSYTGGVAGVNNGYSGVIDNWSFKGNVDVSSSGRDQYAGGLIGRWNADGATFTNMTVNGSVKGCEGWVSGIYIGGLQKVFSEASTFTFGTEAGPCKIISGSTLDGSTVTSSSINQANVFPYHSTQTVAPTLDFTYLTVSDE